MSRAAGGGAALLAGAGSFGQGTGRSESWDSEPSRRSGSESNLGEESDVSSSRSGGSSSEIEH